MRMVSNSTQDQTAGYLAAKVQAGTNITLTTIDAGGDEKLEISGALIPVDDHEVIVTGADTTPGYLGAKLAAGSNVSLSTLNPGANEQVQIDVTIPPSVDELVKASVADTTPDYLASKLAAGSNVGLSIVNPGANEQVQIDVTIPPSVDELVKASVADTTPDYLASKLAAGSNVGLSIINPGANEQVQIDVTIPPTVDELVKASVADTTPDYLSSKITAGTNIALTILNPGANESIQIDATGSGNPARTDVTSLCTLNGYTGVPAAFRVYRRYLGDGKRLAYDFYISATSLGAGTSISIPDTAASSATAAGQWVNGIFAIDGVNLATPGMAAIGGGTPTEISLYKDWTTTTPFSAGVITTIGSIEFDID